MLRWSQNLLKENECIARKSWNQFVKCYKLFSSMYILINVMLTINFVGVSKKIIFEKKFFRHFQQLCI